METGLIVALIALVGNVVTGTVTYYLAVSKTKRELKGEFGSFYQREKFEAHRSLWSQLSPLSNRHSQHVLLKDAYLKLWVEDIIKFFYSEHGLLIQKPVRSKMFDIVDYLEDDEPKDYGVLDVLKRNLLGEITLATGQTVEDANDFDKSLLQ